MVTSPASPGALPSLARIEPRLLRTAAVGGRMPLADLRSTARLIHPPVAGTRRA
jgi:hypothetical protein